MFSISLSSVTVCRFLLNLRQVNEEGIATNPSHFSGFTSSLSFRIPDAMIGSPGEDDESVELDEDRDP